MDPYGQFIVNFDVVMFCPWGPVAVCCENWSGCVVLSAKQPVSLISTRKIQRKNEGLLFPTCSSLHHSQKKRGRVAPGLEMQTN